MEVINEDKAVITQKCEDTSKSFFYQDYSDFIYIGAKWIALYFLSVEFFGG